jgi:hypothetical protein
LKRDVLKLRRAVVCSYAPMKFLLTLFLWAILVVLCWPLAVLLLLTWPVLWLLSLPFRVVAIVVEALLRFIKALLFLPARILGEKS